MSTLIEDVKHLRTCYKQNREITDGYSKYRVDKITADFRKMISTIRVYTLCYKLHDIIFLAHNLNQVQA